MGFIFEVFDKTGRKIHLSKERWSHIRTEHPEISEPNDLVLALSSTQKMLLSDRDENVMWYFMFKKEKKLYLKVAVKYLNGEGYVITAHYTSKIQ